MHPLKKNMFSVFQQECFIQKTHCVFAKPTTFESIDVWCPKMCDAFFLEDIAFKLQGLIQLYKNDFNWALYSTTSKYGEKRENLFVYIICIYNISILLFTRGNSNLKTLSPVRHGPATANLGWGSCGSLHGRGQPRAGWILVDLVVIFSHVIFEKDFEMSKTLKIFFKHTMGKVTYMRTSEISKQDHTFVSMNC